MSDRPERPAVSKKGASSGDDDVTSAKKQPFAMCWECHEKLGSGQFADVFRATEKRPKDKLRPRIVGAWRRALNAALEALREGPYARPQALREQAGRRQHTG